MKTLCLCEALTGPFPSPFTHIKLCKSSSFELSSSSPFKWRSRCNSFKFANRSCEHMKEDNPLSGHIHSTFGEMHDMKFRCIDKSKSLNLEEHKGGYFLIDEIQETIKWHHMCASLKDKSASFPKFHVGSKMGVLIGILTFQAYQQAIAATDFTHGVQSLSFFEELGDINTGILADFFLRARRQNIFYCCTFSCSEFWCCCFCWYIWSTCGHDYYICCSWSHIPLC